MSPEIFKGVIPALMTPVRADRSPDHAALVATARRLIGTGMTAVVYCGSMGDWALLSDEQRMEGVEYLVQAGVPVIVGTGAQNTARAVRLAEHAQDVGARGLMVIPRVLSRGTSPSAQRAHFEAVLGAAPQLPAVIYNSPYYGFETKADLFFTLRRAHANLVGFKEFGGAAALRYAAEHITSADDGVVLMVGVDTQVFHGYVTCGAAGAITGIGNVLPREVLHLVGLCRRALAGDAQARSDARDLEQALVVLSSFDEGPDLVLYYKHLMVCEGEAAYARQIIASDALSESQRAYADRQLALFKAWYAAWPGRTR